eukprot:TRINITY_DN6779_c0_g1_i3.p1 TRINITY_DN6779_c0_g1~~TRINITY_DN6779_c0_g1_i3.p1  ORF type:complete len:104 (+),score=29.84 TRINITY_DN6779_c0_g1_i3:35-346(+)
MLSRVIIFHLQSTLFLFFFFFFKQKTAYEMLRSLVGSEMCIRDSTPTIHPGGCDQAVCTWCSTAGCTDCTWLVILCVPSRGCHKAGATQLAQRKQAQEDEDEG